MDRYITKTRLFKYIENFTTKYENFQTKHSGSFHISSQNIDSGYLFWSAGLHGLINVYLEQYSNTELDIVPV